LFFERNLKIKLRSSYGFFQKQLKEGSNIMIFSKQKRIVSLTVAIIIATVLAVGMFFVSPSVARATDFTDDDIFGMIISYNGDTETSRGLSFFSSPRFRDGADVWVSTSDDFSGSVRLRSEVTVYNLQMDARVGDNNIPTLERADYFRHRVLLTGLAAATTYYVRAGCSESNTWGPVASFRTGGGDRISFAHITDMHVGAWQGGENRSADFVDAALRDAFSRNPNIDFVAGTGDFVTQWFHRPNLSAYHGYFFMQEEWIEALMSSDYLRRATFVNVTGNHDNYHGGTTGMIGGQPRPSRVDFAHSDYRNFNVGINSGIDTARGLNYSFRVGNAHFAVVTRYDSTGFTNEQHIWLRSVFADCDADFRIVFNHYPVFEGRSSAHAETRDMALFRELEIDFTFSGHRHFYHRSRAMDGNAPRADIQDFIIDETDGNVRREFYWERQGVVYVTNSTTGGSDEFRNNFQHRTAHSFFPDSRVPVANPNVANFFGREPTNAEATRPLGHYEIAPRGVGVLPGIGTVGHRSGMYSIITIEDGNLTVDVFVRVGTDPNAPFHLFETFGVRKNYFREIDRRIEALPALNQLTDADLPAFQAIYDRLVDYRDAFPKLAAEVSELNLFKLETGIRLLTDPNFNFSDIADRAAFHSAIMDALSVDRQVYSSETWVYFDNAIRNATKIFIDTNATDIQIANAIIAINQTRQNLVAIDRTALVVVRAEAVELTRNNFPLDMWEELQSAINSTGTMMASLSQTAIDTATASLQSVMAPFVAKNSLTTLIFEAELRQKTNYTEASWASFLVALAEARLAMDSFDYEEMSVATDNLREAMDGLVARQPTNGGGGCGGCGTTIFGGSSGTGLFVFMGGLMLLLILAIMSRKKRVSS